MEQNYVTVTLCINRRDCHDTIQYDKNVLFQD